MKKFLIICAVLIIGAGVWNYVSDRKGVVVQTNTQKKTETFTGVSGKEILVDTGNGLKPFEIRGVNMGVGIPGHFATDYAVDKETYLRWFRMIQDMGANCVRVYTLLQEDFYDAVWEYNHDNPDPLYFIHGVWVNDYTLYSHRDAYDPDFLNELLKDCRTLVDMIHGNENFSLGEDLGNGSYTKDISPWVLGYILGVEWEDTTVAFTDHMEDERNSYQGQYMYTTEEASPFEAMLAQVGDKIIAYETEKYAQQRLIAFSNWPTTDPLEWNDTVEWYFRKFEQVDVEHIKTTENFLSGQLASYHIYPYFPDYLGFMDVIGMHPENKSAFIDEDGAFNSYRAYLTAINEYHTMPVVISEYGVPSSRGRAQSDRNTDRCQGGMSEEEQGQALVRCYEDIMAAGCAGSVAFTWQDEWFKRTWNTMAYTDLTKTCYWNDYQTNEQHFGILSFDPGEEESVCYVDGSVEEWDEADIVMEKDGMSLSAMYDEKYVYFRVHKEGFQFGSKTLYLPIDTTQKSGSKTCEGVQTSFERNADFLLVIDGKENSRLLVQERYEALRAMYAHRVYGEDAYLNEPERDSDQFTTIRLMLQIANDPSFELNPDGYESAETFDTGTLTYGNGNPDAEEFNSLADFIVAGDEIEIRIPWSLLNFYNPSDMEIHDDYYENYGIEGMKIDEMYAGVGESLTDVISMGTIALEGWGRNPTYHERLKQGYYDLQELWTEKKNAG